MQCCLHEIMEKEFNNYSPLLYLTGHELIHLVGAIFLTYFLYRVFRSKRATIICLTYSFFIDIDHVLDFYFYNGITINIFSFFATPYFMNSGKVYVLLHGWEYIIFLLCLSVFLKKHRDIFFAFCFAIFGHLLTDQFCYGMKPFKYFLLYRWLYGFGIEL